MCERAMCSYTWSAVLVKLIKDWLSGCWVLVGTKGLFLVIQNILMFWVERNLSLYLKRKKKAQQTTFMVFLVILSWCHTQRYCWKVQSSVITCAGTQWVSQHFIQRFHLCSSCWPPSIPSMADPGHYITTALAETCSNADVLTLKMKLEFELCFMPVPHQNQILQLCLGGFAGWLVQAVVPQFIHHFL